MMKETEAIVHFNLDFLPLKTNAHIVEANALRINWREVITADKLNYIMGNPPFVGYSLQSKEQKNDLLSVDEHIRKNVDYVSGWYFKAAVFIANTGIRCAFVSTNSIVQGEQVISIWKPLFGEYKISIDFAYQTFRWDSEATQKAAVHCVIIGFSRNINTSRKKLYVNDRMMYVDNISGYLLNMPSDIFIERRRLPLCDVPVFKRGSQPTDNGNFIFTEKEMQEFVLKEPLAKKLIRPYMMGQDFINRKPRYCLWLVGVEPSLINRCKLVKERVEKVREYRLKSSKAATRKKADTPTLFDEVRFSKTLYIAIPEVSSGSRRYIPIDYLTPDIICGNKIRFMSDANLYYFGVLTSNVHMAWMRTVAGRLKSDYDYSNTIVYNNFPWPTPTDVQKARIEKTAQAILDARALYPDSSLADLYDELTMPKELRRAHQENDKAVMTAYGFDWRSMTESQCVAELMKMYQQLTAREQC